MEVKILEVSSKELKRALIKSGNKNKLPGINENWFFNFKKHSSAAKLKAFILVREDTPAVIEGCLIYSVHETYGPFMNYLEVAPHNKGLTGKYKYVACCLIAFACGLAFEVEGPDKGILTFQAYGKNATFKKKLETLYQMRYGAKMNPWGYMEIPPDESKRLIALYLNREA